MPPNVIDIRHHEVIQAAMDGRCTEAAELAAIGERQDITAHGINSEQAISWLSTRALVAELCGSPDQAAQLRATVARMGKDVEWFQKTGDDASPQWHRGPQPPTPALHDTPSEAPRRRTWPYVAAIAALAIAGACVWQNASQAEHSQERQEKAAAFKGRSGAALAIDGVNAELVARWNRDRDQVILVLSSYFDRDAKYLRIDASGKSAISTPGPDRLPKDPEIVLPVKDPLADVTVRVAVGGKSWKEGERASSRTVRLSPTGIAYDAETGQRLPSDL
ncbi:hypothetical protein GCM10027074_75380 [Streptomyces deserti]